MRTTLDLPEDLFRRVKARAAMNGTTLKSLVKQYVENGLKHPDLEPALSSKRSQLPVIKRRGKNVVQNVTPQLRAKLELEEDIVKLRRSFGR